MSQETEIPNIQEILQMEEESFKKERAQRVDETPDQYNEERAKSWEIQKEKRIQELNQTLSLDNASANSIRNELGLPEQKIEANTETAENGFEYMNLPTVQEAQKLIEQRLSEEPPNWKVINKAIYEMLTTRPDFANALKESGGDLVKLQRDRKNESDNYNNVLRPQLDRDMEAEGFEGNNNPGWAGYTLRPEAVKKIGPNIKVYETVDVNNPQFIARLPDLGNKLKEIADESDDTMDVKVPNGYLGFLKHNDSIVVHFKNQENAEKVQQAIAQWMNENNIKSAPRELGRTKIAIDQHKTEHTDKSSFSELVSNNIEEWIKKHHGSYDNKILAEQAVIHAINQSSKAPNIAAL